MDNLTHTPRIRCRYCARRIPASAAICPNCQHNPRAFYWKRGHVVALALGALLALALFLTTLGADFMLSAWDNFKPFAAVIPVTPTRAPTRPPITVIITATPRPATKSSAASTSTRVTTNTPRPTEPPFTATPTRTLTPLRGTAAATETFTPIPSPIPVSSPKLVSPTDGERVRGANKHILLSFQPAQPIGAQEFYRLQVDYLDRAGRPVSWCAFTQQSALEFPRELFDDSSPNVRSFLWRVNVARAQQINPRTCDAPYQVLSAPSEVWTFYWY